MNTEILKLKPAIVWHYFKEILEIPRPSKKEDKIVAHLLEFAKKFNLEILQDEIGNVLIRKEATKGMEGKKWVVLQSHVDMVCEKNSNKDFDFENDPIESLIEGEWVTANDTTLGADDGIGVAAQMAILASNDIQHGPIECLFTVDEETGLTGAFGLMEGFLKSKILLNLDSEDEGELFIGCAGGQDTQAWLPFDRESAPEGYKAYKIMVSGLKGGHSGDEIEKGHANANKILNRFLWTNKGEFNMKLNYFDGGNLRNAIAREAYAICLIPELMESKLISAVRKFKKMSRSEFSITEPYMEITINPIEIPDNVIDDESFTELVNAIYACPHGVIAMSQSIENFVETSTNLASVKFLDDEILITTSQRSSVESEKQDITNMVKSVFNLAGGRTKTSDGYPGWTPNPDSEIMNITVDSYKKLFKMEPEVLAIHAGLECGLIGDKYPEMDMISFGPTIKRAHSPEEKIEIDSVSKFWDLTLDVLKNIPNE
ncbi:MAG: aminoacyl-histidine dipeptidase [Bacteroidales bacterium]|jgi:dipeptidase D|nr:cytosol nonspecific dipeptidase [Lentimicrobiaceae bacterium]MDG1136581.1 aminoacyl-histidine dipeptidase [Bacteroidales bacterium]MDG1901597.1 aminoacyl-histidine dipeptidase [Bacteroidales bacterium]